MKVKFGDLTVRQIAGVCSQHPDCVGCPFIDDAVTLQCQVASLARSVHLEVEIDLPDEGDELIEFGRTEE